MAVSSRRQHFNELFNQIKGKTSTINKGYKVAIDYYKRMKDYFGKMLSGDLQENSDQALKKFKKDLKILFDKENGKLRENSIKEIMSKLFYEAGYGANSDQSLLEVIRSLFEQQDGGEKLNNLIKKIEEAREKLKDDAKKQSEEIKQLIAEATKDIKDIPDMLSSINSIISSAAGVNTDGIDTDDLINNIILPYFRRYLAIDPKKNEKVGLFYAVASGFVFEACVADALIELFNKYQTNNVQASHSGKQNRQDDILITKEKIIEKYNEARRSQRQQQPAGNDEFQCIAAVGEFACQHRDQTVGDPPCRNCAADNHTGTMRFCKTVGGNKKEPAVEKINGKRHKISNNPQQHDKKPF